MKCALKVWSFTLGMLVLNTLVNGAVWTTVASMSTGVSNESAAALGGKVYVAGGVIGSTPQSALEVYDPVANSWSVGTPLTNGTSQTDGMQALSNKLYYIGGFISAPTSIMAVYDPTANSWTSGTNLPIQGATGVSGVIGGNIYSTNPVQGGPTLATFLKYDGTSSTWTTKASIPVARANGAGAAINGKLYVAGGNTSSTTSNELDAYDPTTDSWTTLANMPTGVAHAAAVAVGSKLYILGGIDASSTFQSAVQVYDTTTNTWGSDTSLPVTLAGEAAALSGNTLYVFGGDSPSIGNDLSTVRALSVPEPASSGIIAVVFSAILLKRRKR